MALRSELVATTAQVLRIDYGTVRLCARYLGESGLMAQKGRGRSAAHMTPTDATNLLLGVMASDVIKDAPARVKATREATFSGVEYISVDRDDVGRHFPFLRTETGIAPLGTALDTLFDYIVRYGDPLTDQGDPITNLFLEIHRPGLDAAIHLDDGNLCCIARFHRNPPELDGLKGAAHLAKAKKWARVAAGGMKVTTQIGFDQLWPIAHVLRGYKPREGELVLPIYDVKARRK